LDDVLHFSNNRSLPAHSKVTFKGKEANSNITMQIRYFERYSHSVRCGVLIWWWLFFSVDFRWSQQMENDYQNLTLVARMLGCAFSLII